MDAALADPGAFAAVYGAQLGAMGFPPALYGTLRTKLRSEARPAATGAARPSLILTSCASSSTRASASRWNSCRTAPAAASTQPTLRCPPSPMSFS